MKVFRNYWRNYSVIDISSDKIPVHEATGGYAAPKAPAGMTCSDDVFPVTTDDWVSPPRLS